MSHVNKNKHDLFKEMLNNLEDIQISLYSKFTGNKLNELNDDINMILKILKKWKKNLPADKNTAYICGQIDGIVSVYIHLLNDKLKQKEISYQQNKGENKNELHGII